MVGEIQIKIETADNARDPKVVEWAVGLIERGVDLQDVRKMAGLTDVRDYRWRVLQKEIQSYFNPKTELEALTEFYLDQANKVRELERQLVEVDEMVQKGPNVQIITDKDGKVVEIEDKNFHHLIKYRKDLTIAILNESDRQFKNYLDHKKVKDGHGKYAGAKINIFTNVPRPNLEKAAKAAEEAVEELGMAAATSMGEIADE